MNITEDLRFLALTLDGEGRGESQPGIIGIGWTVLNRRTRQQRAGPKGEVSIRDVVLAAWQYSCWNGNDPNLRRLAAITLNTDPLYLRSLGTAALLLHGMYPDPTNGSTNYHTIQAPSATSIWPPNWAPKMIHTVDIGNHRFYKERD